MSLGSLVDRNLILVIVVLVVGTKTDEHAHLLVSNQVLLTLKGIGMDEHLQVLVTTKVDMHGLIYGT